MAYETLAEGGLDYVLCRYGKSRNMFRGPQKRLDRPFIAVLGGTEAYGKFVEQPFPELLEKQLGVTIVNFGVANAGLDMHLNDPVILQACNDAALTVIQITGAQNMSNRFYTVHPRRNDRFVKASKVMQSIWPEVDFADIHFTRHLLTALSASGPERFDKLRQELAEAWVARMRGLIRECGGRVILLWMSDRRPQDPSEIGGDTGPLFVDRAMLEALRGDVIGIVEAVSDKPYREVGTDGMRFSPLDRMAAESLPGPAMHTVAADLLARSVPSYI